MSEKRMKPAIRFAGFTEEWDRRKLGEVASFSKGRGYTKNDLTDSGTPIIHYGRLYTKYEIVISKIDTYTHAKAESVYSQGGEVIVPASGETAEDISRASVVEAAGVLLGGDLNIVYPNVGIDSVFLALSISNGNQQREMAKRAQGKSVVHLHNVDLREVILTYPKKPEQIEVSTFFRSLDTLITLHQRKYDKLVCIKKAMLEKLFPRNGSCVPEIRFAGFTEAWERRKVGKLASETYGGGTPSTSRLDFWNGSLPWIQSSDLTEHHVFGVVPKKYISKTAVKSSATKIVPKNSLAIITRVGVGKLAVIPYSYATSQDFLSLSKLNADMQFVAYLLYKKLQSELNSVQGTSIKGITKDELLAKIVALPARKEQEAIGTFLRTLDRLLTLQQQSLEKLKTLKKAFLEKMFV